MSISTSSRAVLLMLVSWTAVAADFSVSTRDFNDIQDGDLTLMEALAVAAGTGRCLTSGEKSHVSGGNWQEIFVAIPGCPVPIGGSRWIGDPLLPDNFGDGAADTIRFENFANGPVITPFITLVLDENDTLDGRRPDGTLVVIDGNGAARHGLSTEYENCTECYNDDVTVRNLIIEDFNGDCFNIGASNGVELEHVIARSCNTGIAAYVSITGNQPEAFQLRGNAYGRSEVVNNRGDGIYLLGNGATPASNFLITSTLVADNSGAGIHVINVPDVALGLNGSADGVDVSGHLGDPGIHFEGTNTAGGRVVGSSVYFNGKGIQLSGGANGITIGDATNGNLRNLIAGNAAEGVYISGSGTHGNSVEGNLIGAFASGDTNSGNGFDGVLINLGAYGNFVHDNVIVDNGSGSDPSYGWGVQIQDSGSNGNEIADNRIGVHANGTAAGNRLGGVRVRFDAAANLIGTATSDTAQHVAGNAGPGIVIDGEGSDANLIRRNDIGFAPSGSALGNGGDGIVISGGADNNEIGGSASNQGNRIGSSGGDGIDISNDASDGTKVVGNVVGMTAYSGTARGNGGHGVRVAEADTGTIVANLISANGLDGVQMSGSASGWQVTNNQIGTDGDLFAPDKVSNGASGIALVTGANNNQVGTLAAPNLIAGTGTGIYVSGSSTTANVIEGNNIGTGWGVGLGIIAVGNSDRGIHVLSSAHGNTLRGNAIGASGYAGIEISGANNTVITGNIVGRTRNGYYFGNARGIRISSATGTQIGGVNSADRNIVVSNPNYGIGLLPAATGSVVRNNYVGVESDGVTARGNGNAGIVLENADDNALTGNLVSGNNGIGIQLYSGSADNVLTSNLVGTSSLGIAELANASSGILISGINTSGNDLYGNTVAFNTLEGILIEDGSIDNIIGAPGDGNEVFGNGADGIAIRAGDGHQIEGNDVFSNDEDEIDLGNDGATANDPGDLDNGINDLQNHPIIVSTYTNIAQNQTQITVSLDSLVQREYRVTVYGDDECEQNGRGSGVAIASINLTTAANGVGQGAWLGPATTLPRLSASVRDMVNGNSSEIGPCVTNIVRLFEDGFEDPFPNRSSDAPR